MMKKFLLILLIGNLILSSCKDQNEKDSTFAQEVVDKAINRVGGEQFKASEIDFDFRDRHYKAVRNGWKFQYERIWKDSIGEIKDVLSNSGFQRFINDSIISVSDTMAVKYSSSINAVHYFSVLPYGLNDKAVNKTYLGTVEIKGKPYYKIKITFEEEGGGEDFDDIFIYWINKNTNQLDYLAYSYAEENDDVGLRFREAYNRTVVNGLSFNNYNNYKPLVTNDSLFEFDQLIKLDDLFEKDSLQLLSKIELENIKVSLLPTADH